MDNRTVTSVNDGMRRRRRILYKITVSAVFLSLALVIKTFTSFYLPILGAAGIKVSFSGIFTAFPALLAGPVYGGIVCALSDLLGYIISPTGAYIPLLTLTAFLSGFLTGVVWRFTMKHKRKSNRAVTAAVAVFFLVLGTTGAAIHASLNADNVISGITADGMSLPSRGRLISADLSPLSRFICGLARYSNDTITVTGAAGAINAESFALPESYDVDGYPYKITKIAAGAFSGSSALKTIFIPSSVTGIDPAAFSGDITICAPPDSFAAGFAAENGFGFIETDFEGFSEKFGGGVPAPEMLKFEITDKFRANLAGYINFLTVGLELISFFVLAIIGIGSFITYRYEKKPSNSFFNVPREGSYICILLAVFLPRLLVTTLNTEILRQFLTVWNDRAFIVLWIPRAAEEILSGIVQSYLIMILYAVYNANIKTIFKKSLLKNKIT